MFDLIYKHHNYDIYKTNASELINLVEPADFQRFRDDDHVTEIYNCQIGRYEQIGKFDFITPIVLGCIPDSEKYLILDGQHRIACIERLLKSYPDFEIIVNVFTGNQQRLYDVYYFLNKNKEVTLFENIDESKIITKTVKHFQDTYKPFIKTTKRPHAPSINLDILSKNISNSQIIKTLKISSSEQLIQMIEEIHTFYKQRTSETWTRWNFTDFKKIRDDSQKNGIRFYLGFYQNYEWIHKIIEKQLNNIPYFEMEHLPYNNNEKISKRIRERLWHQYHGDFKVGECFCCCKVIRDDEFEAGHVIARIFGGPNTLENLRVVCRKCNLDMGTENLLEYKKQKEEEKQKEEN